MDFEQLSKKYRDLKSPVVSDILNKPESGKTNSLMEIIKKEDTFSKKQSKRFYIISAITTVLYVLIFIINPDPELTLTYRIAGSCYVAASLILFALFWKKHKKEIHNREGCRSACRHWKNNKG